MKTRLLISITALLALSSCTSLRESLGIERSAPNEYEVAPSQVDLEMPPDFYKLPPPQPGSPRPQETLHMGEELLTGHPHYSQDPSHHQSAGTISFLEKAGVESGHDSIRQELYQEAEIEKRKGGTVAQQLGLKDRRPGEVLKPVEEQARLQKAGVSTSQYVEEDMDADAD